MQSIKKLLALVFKRWQKYKSDPNSQAFLKNKIAKGGSGSWGVVPMPANSKLSDADLSTLTSWILRGAPNKN